MGLVYMESQHKNHKSYHINTTSFFVMGFLERIRDILYSMHIGILAVSWSFRNRLWLYA